MRISTKHLLGECLFNDGKFCRIDIPIRVMAVEDYAKKRAINNLWWRMQYAKLWFQWGKGGIDCNEYSGMIVKQMNRMTNMVSAFDYGVFPRIPLIVGNNYALKDGSHRLSCHIYYNSKEIPVDVLDTPYYKPSGIDEAIKHLYSDEEWASIIEYKNNMLKRYGLS